MFRLTRQVRFAIDPTGNAAPAGEVENAHAGWPPLCGLGYFFMLDVTVAGELDQKSDYLLNIRDIDQAVRQRAIPLIARIVREQPQAIGARAIRDLFAELKDCWTPARLESLAIWLSPFLSVSALAWELPMTRLSQKFEFAASHRLHNPALPDEENRRIFGKCNNPHGHGHNYELQVTISGKAEGGMVMSVPELERIVRQTVIDRFDHRNLNVELAEFASVIPSVENIARVIYRLLAPPLKTPRSRLASVTVWETPKTWCEYSE